MVKVVIIAFLSLSLIACANPNLQLDQNNHLAQIDVSLALQALQANDKISAKAKLLDALNLAPDSAFVQAAWGYYLAQTGDVINAAAAYEYALRLAPDDPQIQDDYAVFLYQQKKYQQALNYFVNAASNAHYLYSALAYENASLAAAQLGDAKLAALYRQKAMAAGQN